jgi:hypothetical protein
LGRPGVHPDTSPYCKARARLPKATLLDILQATAQRAEQGIRAFWRFHDRDVKVVDGTTLSAPDTKKNQRAFPQSASQKEGCGFPLIRLVGLFSLADRLFCDYVTIAWLGKGGVDSVLRLNEKRARDFRKGKRLGKYDRLARIFHNPTRNSTKKLCGSPDFTEPFTLAAVCSAGDRVLGV